jgi:hypothetical protein
MRGRYPLGLEAVDKLEGSAQAKERMKVILETLTGQCRLHEACERLGLSEPRVQQLRQQMLEGALASLEPGQAGRPAKVPSAAEQRVAELEAQVAALQVEQRAAQVREEIQAILPRVAHDALAEEPPPREKKTPVKPARPRPRRPGRRKNT